MNTEYKKKAAELYKNVGLNFRLATLFVYRVLQIKNNFV